MSGQDVAAVLDAECAFEERLHQVAQGAENHHHQSQSDQDGDGDAVGVVCGEVSYDGGRHNDEDGATDASFPTLPWRYAGEELVLPEE